MKLIRTIVTYWRSDRNPFPGDVVRVVRGSWNPEKAVKARQERQRVAESIRLRVIAEYRADEVYKALEEGGE